MVCMKCGATYEQKDVPLIKVKLQCEDEVYGVNRINIRGEYLDFCPKCFPERLKVAVGYYDAGEIVSEGVSKGE